MKIPVEMAQFALKEQKYKQVATYTASLFLFSGNVHESDKPVQQIATATEIPGSSVYRYFNWLLDRNWFGKNEHGRYYFRGIDKVHAIENWRFARAAIIRKKDLRNMKAFLAGVVCASLVQTGKGQRREPIRRQRSTGSKHTVGLISLSLLARVLNVHKSTAYRLRKLADEKNYIENEPNLVKIENISANELKRLRKIDINKIPVELFGYSDKRIVSIDRIRYENDQLKLQEPNKIKCLLKLKSRRGLSSYCPVKSPR